jgi:hypothetical protein
MLLNRSDFHSVVRLAPLVSIDLIIRNARGEVLLGLRNNEPAKGLFFVPGGIIRKQERLLYNLILALKPGARVGIVDTFRRTSEHGTPPDLLRCELAAVGYREISLDRLTGSDAYLAIFAPPSVASRTRPEAMIACKAP